MDAAQPAPPFSNLNVPVKTLIYVILIVGAVVMMLPFIWMASTACKTRQEINTLPIRFIPETPICMENFAALYETSEDFNHYLVNSALLTAGRTLGQLVTCSLAAYGFARFPFPG